MSDDRAIFPSTRLLDSQEMAAADQNAVEMGISIAVLLETAGRAVAEHILRRYLDALRIAVLAGPGNNGGDALVAARYLLEAGRSVELFGASPSNRDLLPAGAGAPAGFGSFDAGAHDLVVDGLFGAGLARPIEGEIAAAIERLNAAATPVLSIDLPSGVSGTSGAILGVAVDASECVTFVRRKPGHLLLPGRTLCGRVHVYDIGMPGEALRRATSGHAVLSANEPELWKHILLQPGATGHKYDRGHAVVFSGGASQTGAARLSAAAALRSGAGLVTLASPPSAVLVNAAHLTAVMLKSCGDEKALETLLTDRRLNAFVLGPGFGVGARARAFAGAVLRHGRRLVLDADGLTSFEDEAEALFALSREAGKGSDALVLTPHDGEFARLFPDLADDRELAKPERARRAAERSGAVVVLKGADTVVAAPDRRAAVNTTGSPWLATAGSGDVLAGIVAAQLAQGVPTFEAACAGVWIHGRAAEHFGPGLIAEDLPDLVPRVLAELLA